MAIISGNVKSALWAIRFSQFSFAVILTGIFSWFHNRLFHAGAYPFGTTDVPLGFSTATIFIIFIAVYAASALAQEAMLIIAILDFLLLGGYVASAIVYRHNFNSKCVENTLVRVFDAEREGGCNSVRLGAALLILQILLFTASTILSYRVAKSPPSPAGATVINNEKSLFGRFRRHHSQEPIAESPA
ncbi:hypothetical protein H072_2659 [Dactylellina haptotyla CBS 200.50]|uniref:MARVEL domain-containing protein n=1 Tax=Dactylellina haptotyla (strain CBS 200.50) TaxID=1284197 RepID=S8AKE4_DACHA|nr:hypothetical protein H072_2659 [Dactylellina haptotyla CBS 200.50]